jgi:hypothetical protein
MKDIHTLNEVAEKWERYWNIIAWILLLLCLQQALILLLKVGLGLKGKRKQLIIKLFVINAQTKRYKEWKI